MLIACPHILVRCGLANGGGHMKARGKNWTDLEALKKLLGSLVTNVSMCLALV